MYAPEIRARLIPPQRAILPRKINVLRRFVQEHPGHRADLVCQATACYHSVHVGTTFHRLAIIRSFDAPSIAAPRPQQNRHVMSASRSHKAAFFRKKIAPPSQRSPPKPRHKANFSTGHQTSRLALKTRNFFRQRTPSEQIDPPSLQQRAAATAYANTENHPSSKHIKIDTTKRSPRTLHSKANA